MSYTYYCHGLADRAIDWKDLRGDNATAYAIGSLDRLNGVKLPRCRKEVDNAIAALSDPDGHCGNNLICAGFATQLANVDGNALTQTKKNYIEAFGADNYGMLRQHIDAHTRRVDGSLDADLATLILFTTMKYHIANKAK
jgi:hypothetical protein